MSAVPVNSDAAAAGKAAGGQRSAHSDHALAPAGGAPGAALGGLFGLFAGSDPQGAANSAPGAGVAAPFSSLLADVARDLQVDEITVDSAVEGVALSAFSAHWQQSPASAGGGAEGLAGAALMPVSTGAPEAAAGQSPLRRAMAAAMAAATAQPTADAPPDGSAGGAVREFGPVAAGGKDLPAGLAEAGAQLPPAGEPAGRASAAAIASAAAGEAQIAGPLPPLHAVLRARAQAADGGPAQPVPGMPAADLSTAGRSAAGAGIADGASPAAGALAAVAAQANATALPTAAAAARAGVYGGFDGRFGGPLDDRFDGQLDGQLDGPLDGLAAETADGFAELLRQPLAAAARGGPVQQFSLGRAAGSPGWADALGGRLQMLVGQNLNHAQIRLDPPELGAVEVQINLGERGAQVFFGTDNAAAREVLDAALPRLRELMGEAGFGELQAQVGDGEAGERWAREQGGEAGEQRSAALPAAGDAAGEDGESAVGGASQTVLAKRGGAGFDAYA